MSVSQYKFKAGDILKHKRNLRHLTLLIHGPGKSDNHYDYSWSDSPEIIRDHGDKYVIERNYRLLTKLELILK